MYALMWTDSYKLLDCYSPQLAVPIFELPLPHVHGHSYSDELVRRSKHGRKSPANKFGVLYKSKALTTTGVSCTTYRSASICSLISFQSPCNWIAKILTRPSTAHTSTHVCDECVSRSSSKISRRHNNVLQFPDYRHDVLHLKSRGPILDHHLDIA